MHALPNPLHGLIDTLVSGSNLLRAHTQARVEKVMKSKSTPYILALFVFVSVEGILIEECLPMAGLLATFTLATATPLAIIHYILDD